MLRQDRKNRDDELAKTRYDPIAAGKLKKMTNKRKS